MNASELKTAILAHNPDSRFFSRENMKFAGDTMKNFGVRETIVKAQYNENDQYVLGGIDTPVFELYRKRPVKGGLKTSSYWRKSNFSRLHCIVE